MAKSNTVLDEALAKVTAQANGIFGKMAASIDGQIKEGATELDVIEISRSAGLDIDEATLRELQIDRIIIVHPWLPWYCWWPWRPLWCWWWGRYYPWYRCCPYWWHRCHWYPYPY